MPGAFSNDLTLVEDAEVTTDYSLVGSLKTARALNDDYKIESTNSMTWGVSSATGTGTAHILAVVPGAPVDFSSSGNHFFQWIKGFAWPSMANHASGGTRIAVSSDAPPTAVRATLNATVAAGGTGYTLNDELSLSGGTTTETAVFIATGVSGGIVTSVSPKATARGDYTVLPTNPVSTTGGTGTGCTLTVTWIYSTTNTKEWFIAGPDTVIVDGWVCYVVDVAGTPDLETGAPVVSSVDRMGVGATAIAVSKVATHNMDVSRYGTGITINDGTAGNPVTFEDVRSYDNNNARALGIVVSQSGIFFVAGKFRIGTTGQIAITYFKDTSKVVVYQGFPVSSTFYEIVLAGAVGFVTTFQLGNLSGGVASGGCTIRGADRYTHYGGVATGLVPSIWTLTADAANTLCKLYGCALSQMKAAVFRSDSDVQFCTFQDSGTITPAGCTLKNCTFLDLRTTSPISASYAVDVATSAPTMTDSQFVNCATALRWNVNADTNTKLDNTSFTSGGTGHAVELGANCPATITLQTVTFTGYGADETTNAAIYNNAGKAITINVVGGSTPTVRNGAGASTTVNNSVNLTVKVVDLVTGAAIESAQVAITRNDTGATLMNEATTALGIATEAFAYTVNLAITVRVRKSTTEVQYIPVQVPGTITADGFDLTQALTVDNIIENA